MLSEAKVLYQVKLILDYLPENEYKLIPKETIEYIEDSFEYDENFSIDPSIPLEKQNISDKAYKMLDKIIKKAEDNQKMERREEIRKYVESVKKSNNNYNTKIENIKLKNIIDTLKKENIKIPKARTLLEEYRNALQQKEDEIVKLRQVNQQLYQSVQKIPRFIIKIFIKDL